MLLISRADSIWLTHEVKRTCIRWIIKQLDKTIDYVDHLGQFYYKIEPLRRMKAERKARTVRDSFMFNGWMDKNVRGCIWNDVMLSFWMVTFMCRGGHLHIIILGVIFGLFVKIVDQMRRGKKEAKKKLNLKDSYDLFVVILGIFVKLLSQKKKKKLKEKCSAS